MKEFIIKCVVVTACLIVLINSFNIKMDVNLHHDLSGNYEKPVYIRHDHDRIDHHFDFNLSF
jgi:hypothetical protein